jgi:hypothetical protein
MKHLLILFSVLILSACTENSELQEFHRFEGQWSFEKGDERFVESWEIVNDTLMKGISFMTVKKDTVFKEDLELTSMKNGIFYTPTVPDQNEGAAIRFKLSKKDADKWIFENKKHDFPTEIIYLFKGTDSLIATVQGIQNGRSRKIDFRLHKN